ncbi:unnamed protein product, partial [Adineta ricciae]
MNNNPAKESFGNKDSLNDSKQDDPPMAAASHEKTIIDITSSPTSSDVMSNDKISNDNGRRNNMDDVHATPPTINMQARSSYRVDTITDMDAPFVDMTDSMDQNYYQLLEEFEAESNACYANEYKEKECSSMVVHNDTALEQQCGSFHKVSDEQLDKETEQQLCRLIVSQRPVNDESAEHIL